MAKDGAGGNGTPPAPRRPSVQQQQVDATREQTAELNRIGNLLETVAPKRAPLYGPNFKIEMSVVDADGGSAQRWLWMLRVPGFIDQFQRVPVDYWTADTQTEDGEELMVATVRCPCGEAPIVEHGVARECVCQRLYLYFGDRPLRDRPSRARLLVGNSPKHRPKPRWERIADAAIAQRASSRTRS